MVEFIISSFLIFVILAFSILLWADKHGLNVEALFERINKKVSPDNTVLLHYSPVFFKDCLICVQSLLGDKAYKEHMYLINLHRNFWYGNIEDNCPYIRMTLKIDDSQRDIFEASLKEIVKRNCYYLYGLQDTDVLAEWSKSTEYSGMLQITLFYARNAKEQEMLRRRMEYKTRQIINSCDKVIDDEFGEDLTDDE